VSALAATTPLPSPLAVTGVVSSIMLERVLVVRISDTASGYERETWREAWRALKASEERGWRDADPTVYANTDKADKVASAAAGDAAFGGLLRFTFGPDDPSYVQLVGQPGLTAFVMLDRSSHRFLSVKFRHGRKES
jgi:hypothetical protein